MPGGGLELLLSSAFGLHPDSTRIVRSAKVSTFIQLISGSDSAVDGLPWVVQRGDIMPYHAQQTKEAEFRHARRKRQVVWQEALLSADFTDYIIHGSQL